MLCWDCPPLSSGFSFTSCCRVPGRSARSAFCSRPRRWSLPKCLLGTPIVVALVHRTAVGLWDAYGDSLRIAGASRLRAIPFLMSMGREALLTAFLAAFGRAIAEVGAIMIVGGNIRGYTRTMTTAIALETSKGRSEPGARIGDDTHPHFNDCQRGQSLPGARVHASLMRPFAARRKEKLLAVDAVRRDCVKPGF